MPFFCNSWVLLAAFILYFPGTLFAVESIQIVSDLQNCEPKAALSAKMEQQKWRGIPYQTDQLSGHILAAASFIQAPPVTLKLDLKGWHRISIGIWNPEFSYDGQPLVKIKLSDAPAFRQIHVGATSDTQSTTYLSELPIGEADLTGQDMVIAKSNGMQPRSAFVAYFRFTPMTNDEIDAMQQDRQRNTRNLVACIDGTSYFHFSEYSRPEHFLEQVELYRHSDVEKVLWAATYGNFTNYPTRVPGAQFLGKAARTRLQEGIPGNSYIRGQSQMSKTLAKLGQQNRIPQQICAKHVHSMGLKFDLMFRLGILGGYGLWRTDDNFTNQHPHWRQVRRDGVVVQKASYAFDEVQNLTLALIRESTTLIDADGVNLCFVRGPHFLQYEEPVLHQFQEKYNEDARQVAEDDPRLLRIRANLMTKFIRGARNALDTVGREKGKHLTLSVWVWPSQQNVWLGKTPLEEGLDVIGWIREGLLDSVICQGGIDQEYIQEGNKHNCQFIHFTGYHHDRRMSPNTIHAAYQENIQAFAFWDIDAVQIYPSTWNWLRRIGHQQEIANWAAEGLPETKRIPLTRINGADAKLGLADAVYSGG